jgi:hypothetical protein
VLSDRQWGSENFFQNVGPPVTFEADRWYCIEVSVTLNTPGLPDGVLAAWIDDQPKLLYAGRQFRGAAANDPAPSTARFQALMIAGQYGQSTLTNPQFSWQDDVAASTERIGCQSTPALLR